MDYETMGLESPNDDTLESGVHCCCCSVVSVVQHTHRKRTVPRGRGGRVGTNKTIAIMQHMQEIHAVLWLVMARAP